MTHPFHARHPRPSQPTVLLDLPAALVPEFLPPSSPLDGEGLSAAARLRALAGGTAAVDRLDEAFQAERDGDLDLSGVRVLISNWETPMLDPTVLDRLPSLALLAHTGASVKPFLGEDFFARGLRVTQAGAAMARPVAEVSLTFTLALLHQIPRLDHALHDGTPWEKATRVPAQREIAHSVIGVVGASRTGRAYIQMVQALGAHVLVADPTLDPNNHDLTGSVCVVPLPELLAVSDIVALHAPSLPSTRHLLGAAELALLPDGAGLVNTARSWLVDEAALLTELRSGRIDAALDVYDDEPLPARHPFRSLTNVLLTPHRAAGTVHGRQRAGHLIAAEVERFLSGDALREEIHEHELGTMA